MKVSIVGTGYVGLVTGLCLAEHGHYVTAVDIDASKIARLRGGSVPFFENGVDALLKRHLGSRFFPTTDLPRAVHQTELTLICVGTPLDETGTINLKWVQQAATAIGTTLGEKSDYHVVVVKSTVVPGTTDDLVRPILEETSGKKSGDGFGLGMNPEFLREGQAVEDFQRPDRILLGASDSRCLETMRRVYAGFEGTQQIHTNPRTAEMAKYASNALLATLISFSNEIGNLCSASPAVDAVDVLGAVHLDKRISPVDATGSRITPGITAYLKAGCGFGGSCFPKDVRALIRWSEQHNRSTQLLRSVLTTNESQPLETLRILTRHVPTLESARVAVLGLAFKPDTDDIRESPALQVIPALTARGAQVIAYDPVAVPPTREVLGTRGVEYATALEQAIRGVDAVILLTGWPEFQDLPDLLDKLERPPIVVDGRRVLNKNAITRYDGIGLGSAGAAPQSLGSPRRRWRHVGAAAAALFAIVTIGLAGTGLLRSVVSRGHMPGGRRGWPSRGMTAIVCRSDSAPASSKTRPPRYCEDGVAGGTGSGT